MTYKHAFEICETTVGHMKNRGWMFGPGVERAAALAAMAEETDKSIIEAIEKALYAFRISPNHRWDGSIA